MRGPSSLNYGNLPGIKTSFKLLIKSILFKFYIKPKKSLTDKTYRLKVKFYKMPVEIIENKKGLKNVIYVASYTDGDKNYLPGMLETCRDFEKIILFHDKNKNHNFKYNESLRFQYLVAAAKKNGGKWVLIGSPKTRFSAEFRNQIKPFIGKYKNQKVILTLNERFLWEKFDQFAFPANQPNLKVNKFFTITDEMRFDNAPIHATQHPVNYDKFIKTPASRYYLGRFNRKIMQKKADFYHKKDGNDYSWLLKMTEPKKHHEEILGLGEFEREDLLG